MGWPCSSRSGGRGIPRSSRTITARRRSTSLSADLGLPYAQWSLSHLRYQAVRRGVAESISEEWLRGIFHDDEESHRSNRTWKTCPDPLFEKKKRKIDRLTRKRHNPQVVLSADESGPIQLIPHGGLGMVRRAGARPQSRRASAEVRDGLVLPDPERRPPATVRSGLLDQALGGLAGVS